MMFNSIKQVNEEVFKKFYGIEILVGDNLVKFPLRYARKSSYDYTEQDEQVYPCIAIQDYAPTLRVNHYVEKLPYLGALSRDGLTAELAHYPVWFDFKYDVSCATKSYKEFLAIQDYFNKRYVGELGFMLNSKLSEHPGFEVGNVVPYEIEVTNVPRSDGIFEMNYEFTLNVWVSVTDSEEVDLVRRIVIDGKPTNIT